MAIFILIFFLLMVAYGWVIEQYRRGWNRIPEFNADNHLPSTFISVIIPVRNEQRNVAQLLQSLQLQDYPASLWEVIIVDDDSMDDTPALLRKAQLQLHNLKVITLSGTQAVTGHKKTALAAGIAAATGTLIITTDADCIFPNTWVSTITAYYEINGPVMMAAPVRLEGRPSILYYFQVLDFLSLQGITGAAVHHRMHILCNGANLAYEKKVFEAVRGFEGISNIASGDDMLLMQKVRATYPSRIGYIKSSNAIVATAAADSWKAFFNQRIRWASKATFYDDKKLLRILLLVYAVNVCFLLLFLAGFWKSMAFFFLFVFLVAKIIIEFPFVQSVAVFYGQSSHMKYFPLLQPVHILYTIIAGFLGKFTKFEWKGRTLKK